MYIVTENRILMVDLALKYFVIALLFISDRLERALIISLMANGFVVC